MTPTLPLRILAAASALALLLVGLVLHEDWSREHGREVRLPMEPVDPQDLLSGHFVSLQLTQSLPAGAPCPPGTESGGGFADRRGAGWVALTPSPTGDRVSGAAKSHDAAARWGPILVRGTAFCTSVTRASPGETAAISGSVTVQLGIRGFHADRHTAQTLGASLLRVPAQALAVVSLGKDGRARLKGLIVNDRRYDLNWN